MPDPIHAPSAAVLVTGAAGDLVDAAAGMAPQTADCGQIGKRSPWA